jgi:hypothetical protein
MGLVGVLVGAGASLAIEGPDTEAPATPSVATVPVPQADEGLLLVWTSGGLPAGLAASVAQLPDVAGVTSVRGRAVDLHRSVDADGTVVDQPATGWAIPLDGIAIDPATFADVAGFDARLGPGQALLGATSARVRRLGAGAVLDVEGGPVTVIGVVDDTVVGAAEVVFAVDEGARHGVTTERYLLVRHQGARAATERAVREVLPPGVAVRFRSPGETPFLREGDAVLPQALIKDRFGEFSYRRASGRDVEIDSSWVAEHIVTADVPLLGRVRCHRTFMPAFAGALGDLRDEGLGYLVDQAGFAGCWAPRLVDVGRPLSRHAWGAAFDINVLKNTAGRGSAQDPRLVAIMRRWGLTFGGSWLEPDPAHFEYLRPPAR